jgi:hypothetical protein
MKEGTKEDKKKGKKKEGTKRGERIMLRCLLFNVFKLLLSMAESRIKFMFIFRGCCKIMCSEY